VKVAVITQASFPEGLAPTNRVIYHAKGLRANGIETKIFITLPTENWRNVKNINTRGEILGIPYEYVWKETKRSKYFIGRRIHDLLSPLRTAFKIRKEKYEAALLISFCSYYVITVLKFFCFLFDIKLIAERTELPKTEKGILQIKNQIMVRCVFKNLYGFLAISESLQKYYSRLVSRNCPVVLVPVIIDVSDIYDSSVNRTKNLVYTGPLLQKKDGIITIIQAFKKVADDFPETNLILTGDIDYSTDKERILNELEGKYKDRIIMKGFLTREDMIKLINSAAGLLLAKPSSEQANTCFPTKLGEYLSTGNPIVVTSTGEIPLYLEDMVSAYIAEPDSVESFTMKLVQLLSDPEKASEIGKTGKNVALKSFKYKETSKRVISLIEDRKIFLKRNKTEK
jgi:glycosyltransferase involved in cell wall biosynthesis